MTFFYFNLFLAEIKNHQKMMMIWRELLHLIGNWHVQYDIVRCPACQRCVWCWCTLWALRVQGWPRAPTQGYAHCKERKRQQQCRKVQEWRIPFLRLECVLLEYNSVSYSYNMHSPSHAFIAAAVLLLLLLLYSLLLLHYYVFPLLLLLLYYYYYDSTQRNKKERRLLDDPRPCSPSIAGCTLTPRLSRNQANLVRDSGF